MITSRRKFLQTATISAAGAWLYSTGRAKAFGAGTSVENITTSTRLDNGWEFYKGAFADVGSAWGSSKELAWQHATLPHCFNAMDACDPDTSYYRGQGWYKTHLTVKNPFANGRTVLHFQGAGQTTTVWVGNAKITTHKGGYDEFVCDITAAIAALKSEERKEGVPVTVMCDNTPDKDRVPSDLSDFCLYGGLYRHVNLLYLPAVSLEEVHISPTLQADGTATVSVKVGLFNPESQKETCAIVLEVLDAQGKAIYRTDKKTSTTETKFNVAEFNVKQPQLWSPQTPHLYRCRVTLTSAAGTCVVEERFGIRSIEFVEHGPFKLNGQRVLLKGTQRHADHAGLAAAMGDNLVREEMRMIREMGANFIRLGHYQQDRLVLDLCDELGLMVWEEAPWCRAGIGGEAFQENAKGMLANMIHQHYNHPSIILWGLGNEDDWPDEYPDMNHDKIRAFMTEMRDLAHSLDSSRLTSFRRCDFARDIPDVYSPSIWAGWYRGDYHEYEQTLNTERERVKRMIHIEWGADSHAGRHAEDPEAVLRKIKKGSGTDERGLDYLKTGGDVRMSRDGDWSETYACNLFDWHLKVQETLDWFTGSAQWIFKDFPSPLRGDNGIPRINQKGVVERDLRRKESYYVFQSYWAEKPMVHIYGHSWPVRWGKTDEKRWVHVYSNCESAELFVNGVSQGKKKRDSQNFPSAGLRWDTNLVSGKNHLRAVAVKNGVTVIDEIDFEYQTAAWGKPAIVRIKEIQRKGDIVTIEAKIYDAQGVQCLDAGMYLHFGLTGEGRLIDNLGTVRASRLVQFANGYAQISLHRNGTCKITAAVEGLPTAELSV